MYTEPIVIGTVVGTLLMIIAVLVTIKEERQKEAEKRTRKAREWQKTLDHELNVGRRIFNFLSMVVDGFGREDFEIKRLEGDGKSLHYSILIKQVDTCSLALAGTHLPILHVSVRIADEFDPHIQIQHGTFGHVDLFDNTEDGIKSTLRTATQALVEFDKENMPC